MTSKSDKVPAPKRAARILPRATRKQPDRMLPSGRSGAGPSVADTGDFLSAEEIRKLFAAAAVGAGEEGITKGEFAPVVEWAQVTRLRQIVLDMILAGQVLPGFRDGEVVFRAVGTEGTSAEVADLWAAFQRIEQRRPQGNR